MSTKNHRSTWLYHKTEYWSSPKTRGTYGKIRQGRKKAVKQQKKNGRNVGGKTIDTPVIYLKNLYTNGCTSCYNLLAWCQLSTEPLSPESSAQHQPATWSQQTGDFSVEFRMFREKSSHKFLNYQPFSRTYVLLLHIYVLAHYGSLHTRYTYVQQLYILHDAIPSVEDARPKAS